MAHSSRNPSSRTDGERLSRYALGFCVYYIVWLPIFLLANAVPASIQQKQAWLHGLSGVHIQWARNLSASWLLSMIVALIIVWVWSVIARIHVYWRAL